MGQLPGHEEAQSGQAPSAHSVCVCVLGWGDVGIVSGGCIGILGLSAAAKAQREQEPDLLPSLQLP